MPIDEIKKVFFVGAGPFGMMDGIGLNVVYDVCAAAGELNAANRERALRIVEFLKPFIDRGDLGMKTGKGFYAYPDAKWQQPEFLKI